MVIGELRAAGKRSACQMPIQLCSTKKREGKEKDNDALQGFKQDHGTSVGEDVLKFHMRAIGYLPAACLAGRLGSLWWVEGEEKGGGGD